MGKVALIPGARRYVRHQPHGAVAFRVGAVRRR